MKRKLSFGKRLRELRQEKNLTRQKLGEVLGVTGTTITRYESGERIPDIFVFYDLAEYFNVSIDYMVGKEDF